MIRYVGMIEHVNPACNGVLHPGISDPFKIGDPSAIPPALEPAHPAFGTVGMTKLLLSSGARMDMGSSL